VVSTGFYDQGMQCEQKVVYRQLSGLGTNVNQLHEIKQQGRKQNRLTATNDSQRNEVLFFPPLVKVNICNPGLISFWIFNSIT
jgi:hypothetical protein